MFLWGNKINSNYNSDAYKVNRKDKANEVQSINKNLKDDKKGNDKKKPKNKKKDIQKDDSVENIKYDSDKKIEKSERKGKFIDISKWKDD